MSIAPEAVGDATGGRAAPAVAAPARPEGWAAGIGLMTGSAAAAQLGGAVAAQAFGSLGPLGVVAVRQWVASALMLAATRPRVTAFTARQWRPVLALALVYMVMNTTLYLGIARIGLGLAITLEFVGPLSLALAASRRVTDYGCAGLAAAAVVVLARPQPSTDYLGIGLSLVAAAGWAGYIIVNRDLGRQFAGAQGSAAAISISALLYIPVGVVMLATHPVTSAAR